MSACFVYALREPGGEIRYIGISSAPLLRFEEHLDDKARTWKTNWIQTLKNKGQRPVLDVLYECSTRERAKLLESRLIAALRRAVGARLTNGTHEHPLQTSTARHLSRLLRRK